MGADRRTVAPGDSVLIRILAIHRIENERAADQLDEDDIEQLHDVYGQSR